MPRYPSTEHPYEPDDTLPLVRPMFFDDGFVGEASSASAGNETVTHANSSNDERREAEAKPSPNKGKEREHNNALNERGLNVEEGDGNSEQEPEGELQASASGAVDNQCFYCLLETLDSDSDTEHHHDQPAAVVTLLQSTMRSSQSRFRRVSRLWGPISGHWAVEIRGEVFDLNRAKPWPEDGWARIQSNLVLRVVNAIFNFLFRIGCMPLAGAQASIDVSDVDDYLAFRGAHTITRFKFGTIRMTQKRIKRASTAPSPRLR